MKVRGVKLFALWVIIVWMLVSNIAWSGRFLASRVGSIILHPSRSYDEKMERTFGLFYDFMIFVRENTPPDAIIAVPQAFDPRSFGPYRLSVGFTSYFLYPRRTVPLTQTDLGADQSATHAVIVTGSDTTWPLEPLSLGKVTYMPRRVRVFTDDFEVYDQTEQYMLEDFESVATPVLSPMNTHSGRVVNSHRIARITLADRIERLGRQLLKAPYLEPISSSGLQSEYIDVTYTEKGHDYWGFATDDIPLTSETNVIARVMVAGIAEVNWPEVRRCAAIYARVRYADGHMAIFNSSPIDNLREWETLELKHLSAKAREFGQSRGWSVAEMWIDSVGLDIGNIPFEQWGLIELDRDKQ